MNIFSLAENFWFLLKVISIFFFVWDSLYTRLSKTPEDNELVEKKENSKENHRLHKRATDTRCLVKTLTRENKFGI